MRAVGGLARAQGAADALVSSRVAVDELAVEHHAMGAQGFELGDWLVQSLARPRAQRPAVRPVDAQLGAEASNLTSVAHSPATVRRHTRVQQHRRDSDSLARDGRTIGPVSVRAAAGLAAPRRR